MSNLHYSPDLCHLRLLFVVCRVHQNVLTPREYRTREAHIIVAVLCTSHPILYYHRSTCSPADGHRDCVCESLWLNSLSEIILIYLVFLVYVQIIHKLDEIRIKMLGHILFYNRNFLAIS